MSMPSQASFGTPEVWVRQPSVLESFLVFAPGLIFAVIISIFLVYIFSKNEKIQNQPEKYAFFLYFLKSISLFSVLFGIFGFLYLTRIVMVRMGMYAGGNNWYGYYAGPFSEAILPLLFGLFNAMVALTCVFFAKWKTLRASDKAK